MTNDNKVDDDVVVNEDLSILDDATDWKAKAEEIEQKRREDGIRSRERSKALRDQLAEFKSKETPPDKKDSKPDENPLEQKLEKLALRQAGITDPEDIELARKTAKKWNMDIDDVLSDEDFKVKLEKQQTARANIQATSGVRGSGTGTSQAKNTPEYWQAKGVPPTPADVPDGKTRRAIVRSMLTAAKKGTGSKFYNE